MLKTNKPKMTIEEINKNKRELTANQWVPVADIENCIVYRKDNVLVGMIRIQPINIDLLSDKEKKRVISNLAAELNGENEPFQIFCIGRPVDLNNYLEWLQNKAKQEQDYTRKRLLKSFIQETSYLASSGETVERRFYLIITKNNVQKAEVDLITRLNEMRKKFIDAGLGAEVCKDDELLDVYSLFSHPVQAAFERDLIEKDLPTLLEF